MVINGRTDLANEVRRRLCDGSSVTELPGVRAREERIGSYDITSVEILDPQGEQLLGKPAGRYVTMELPPRFREDSSGAAHTLARLIRQTAGTLPATVLLAALGNPDITPDALGSLCASRLLVTAHLKDRDPESFDAFRRTFLFRPGVLGTSGLESARQIRSLCQECRPGLVIAVDALAGADLQMLCRSVQISDSGIAPGSGVGNARQAMTREMLGVPVLAIGVPTVVDASSFSSDPALQGMFVTPRSIDSLVRSCAGLIAAGINLALHPKVSLEEMELLTAD